MLKKLIKKESLVLLLLFFIFIPSKSYADVVDLPIMPVFYFGKTVLLIIMAIILVVGISVFIIREEYKKEKLMKALKRIVIVLAYIFIAWLAYSIAEYLIINANHYGIFSMKNSLTALIFLDILIAVFIISMIYRIQNEKVKSNAVIIIGGVCAILIFFWGKLFYFI